jgi:hypothetical protein
VIIDYIEFIVEFTQAGQRDVIMLTWHVAWHVAWYIKALPVYQTLHSNHPENMFRAVFVIFVIAQISFARPIQIAIDGPLYAMPPGAVCFEVIVGRHVQRIRVLDTAEVVDAWIGASRSKNAVARAVVVAAYLSNNKMTPLERSAFSEAYRSLRNLMRRGKHKPSVTRLNLDPVAYLKCTPIGNV